MGWFKQIGNVFVIVFLGFIAIMTGRFSLLFLCGGFALLWVMQMVLHSFVWRQTITVQRTAMPYVLAGTDCRVQVSVQASRTIPLLWITIKDEWHHKRLFSFFDRNILYEYTIPGIPRGLYGSETIALELEDCFGLISQRRKVPSSLSIVAYPYARIHAVKALPVPDYGEAETELRPYVHGDRLSAIHWKWSMKRRQWIVRANANKEQSEMEIMLLLDGSVEWFEQRVEIVAGWISVYGDHLKWALATIDHRLQNGRQIEDETAKDRINDLTKVTGDKEAVRNRVRTRHRESFKENNPLKLLAGLKPNELVPADQVYNFTRCMRTGWLEQTIIYFVSSLNDERIRMCQNWQRLGRTVVIAWCLPPCSPKKDGKKDGTFEKLRQGRRLTLNAGLQIIPVHFTHQDEVYANDEVRAADL